MVHVINASMKKLILIIISVVVIINLIPITQVFNEPYRYSNYNQHFDFTEESGGYDFDMAKRRYHRYLESHPQEKKLIVCYTETSLLNPGGFGSGGKCYLMRTVTDFPINRSNPGNNLAGCLSKKAVEVILARSESPRGIEQHLFVHPQVEVTFELPLIEAFCKKILE